MERIHVPELNGTNYFIWALKIRSALSLKRLETVLSEVKPENLSEKDSTEWDEKNSDAVAYIKLSLADEQALQFASEQNAKILWEKIKTTFTGQIEDRKIDAGNELKNLEIKKQESCTDYVARARGIATKCQSLGLEISSRELVYYTVRGLRGHFSNVRDILKTQRDKSMDEVLEILREEESAMNCSSSRSEGTNAEVFYTKRNKNSTGTVRLCYLCRRPNHVAKNCFYRNSGRTNSPSVNKKKVQYRSKNEQKQNSLFTATVWTNNDCEIDKVWILDSGASNHMCKDKLWFESYEPEIQDIHLAGKNSKIISEGYGSVKAKTESNKNSMTLTISNVSYVPDLRYNLISVTTLMEKGCKIKSVNDHVVLVFDKDDVLVLKAFKNDNRLEVYLEPVINECNLTSRSGISNYELWHSRLCHLNGKYMNIMKDYVNFDIDNTNDFRCNVCDISKITRKPHPNVDINQSSEILELLHVDLVGSIKPESFGGSKYFMVIVDDFSGMYFTYFLKSKDEVFDVFCEFKAKYENLTGKRIKRIRSDNGLELVNTRLDNFLATSGIFHEKTVAYNSESNGKAERANRVLLERARTILYESDLPSKFWAEAINFSTRISNVTPRKGKDKIPLEIWTGKKPNLSYLKKFGCVAYFHVPKVLRNKFDIPGKCGIFLGYSRDRKAYRIYDIEKSKIIEERSVKFNESCNGSIYLKNNKKEQCWDINSLYPFSEQNENEKMHLQSKILEPCQIGEARSGIISVEINESADYQGMNEKGGNEQEQMIVDQDISQLRRSERLKNKNLLANLTCSVPDNYLEAKKSVNWHNWEIAMKNEINSLNKHNVWEIIDKPENIKLVKSKWVFSLKENDLGETIYKARLVAAGYNQIKNKDYSESFSPVVNMESFRLLLALAAKLNLITKFYDVKTAYLYSNLEEDVFMTPPPGYESLIGEGKVCKLNKSIYGLPQSGRNWYMKIKTELEKIGLVQLASDNCVFMKVDNENIFILCMYVDDIAVFCNNSDMCDNIISKIKIVFELHENNKSKFLGMEIVKHDNGISLSQIEYIDSLLLKYNLVNCNSVKTPIVKGEDRSFPPTDDLIDMTEYQELIGELLYLANRTRPDISFVTSYLSQFNHKPEKRHYNLAKRVLRYLKGTKDKRLFYDNEFGFLNASADASWGNAENGKSFSGGVILLGNSLITWKCKKQKSVSLSTCEAELFSISEICKDVIWLRNLLSELNFKQFVNDSVSLGSDSQAAIQWIKCSRSSTKSRHMNLRFHFVKDLLIDNVIKLEYIQSEYIVADFLTKGVNEEKLVYSMKSISLIN